MGGVWMLSARVALCDSVPDVPVKVTVEAPIAAVLLAVKLMFCAVPGASVRDAGLAVTLVGRPVMLTATGEAKPPIAVACNDRAVPVVPWTSVWDAGVTVREKSGVG